MGKRLGLSIEIAFTLFGVSVLTSLWFLLKDGTFSWHSLPVIIAVPAVASLALVAFTSLLPGLLAPGRIAYPLNLTLPPLHAMLMLVTLKLLLTGPNGLQVIPESLRQVRFWTNEWVFGSCLVVEVLTLTLVAALSKKPPTAESR